MKLAGSRLRHKRDLLSAQSGWLRNLGSDLSLVVKSAVNKMGVLGEPPKWRENLWAFSAVCFVNGNGISGEIVARATMQKLLFVQCISELLLRRRYFHYYDISQ